MPYDSNIEVINHPKFHLVKWRFVFMIGAIFILSISTEIPAEITPKYIFDLDIEDLMKAEVTSVSRYNQLLMDAPAAVSVITPEQIRRSGFREMPEILRLAPGMQVARQSASLWYASARAFPDEGVNRMLVLSDGRSIYTQGVGRVYWAAQSFILEDLAQVEVIRGPGGTYWGYNAVHGVVNITHKPARETQGMLVDSGLYSDGSDYTQIRYGGLLGNRLYYRIYYDGTNQDDFKTVADEKAFDGFNRDKIGLRVDYDTDADSLLTVEGALFSGEDGDAWSTAPTDTEYDESYLRAKYEKQFSSDLSLMAQAYYENLEHTFGVSRNSVGFNVGQEILDAEFQIDWRAGAGHRLVVGGGTRLSDFDTDSGSSIMFTNQSDHQDRYNVYISDAITLMPEKLWVTIGTKIEYNDASKWGWQPSGRLMYKPSATTSCWGSISRALRMPYIADTADRFVPGPMTNFGPSLVHYSGKPVDDEEIIAYEIGHRNQITPSFSMDVTAYYHRMNRVNFWFLTSFAPPGQPGDMPIYTAENDYRTDVESRGAEVALSWQIIENWSLTGSYSYFHTDFKVPEPETWWIPPKKAERHQVQLHSELDLMADLQLDTHLYWNNEARLGWINIPDYLRLDIRLAYTFFKNVEIALVGQHLLDDRHIELNNGDQSMWHETEIPRRVYINLKWRF